MRWGYPIGWPRVHNAGGRKIDPRRVLASPLPPREVQQTLRRKVRATRESFRCIRFTPKTDLLDLRPSPYFLGLKRPSFLLPSSDPHFSGSLSP